MAVLASVLHYQYMYMIVFLSHCDENPRVTWYQFLSLLQLYFGCTQARYYLTFNVLGLNCFTGMSYLLKKSELDKINGLNFYGQFLAEDFFFSKSLHSK